MSRQITDLSAAGANLFHAVVELQRLRASSERKFQRWFFETRQESERMQEVQAELERALASERSARQAAEQRAEKIEREGRVDTKKTSEMQRELQIAKEEARRAWEELGRREQEERDRTMSLRDGHPTLVGGVQVVPMQASSRHGSTSQRTTTQDRAEQNPQVRAEYSYEDASPTDTDPYASAAARGATSALRHEPDAPSAGQAGYTTYTSRDPVTSTSTAHSGPAHTRPSAVPTTEPSNPEAFYTHAGTYLTTQGGQPHTQQQPTSHPTQQAPASSTSQRPDPAADDATSYIPSIEGDSVVSDEEYEIDAHGNYVLDARGNPLPYRPPRRSDVSSSDSYDVRSEMEREAQLSRQYGAGAGANQQPPLPSTTQGGGGVGPPADYEGQGYGAREYEWAGVQRHHHPTRLSDVLEEDERSRTSPSRSQVGFAF